MLEMTDPVRLVGRTVRVTTADGDDLNGISRSAGLTGIVLDVDGTGRSLPIAGIVSLCSA